MSLNFINKLDDVWTTNEFQIDIEKLRYYNLCYKIFVKLIIVDLNALEILT